MYQTQMVQAHSLKLQIPTEVPVEGKVKQDALSTLSVMVAVRCQIPTALRVGVTCTDW